MTLPGATIALGLDDSGEIAMNPARPSAAIPVPLRTQDSYPLPMRTSSSICMIPVAFAALTFAALTSGCTPSPPPEEPPAEDIFTLTTDEITVPAGAEQYTCYAKTLDRDIVVDRFNFEQSNAVHHLLLARTTLAEKEGLSDCPVLFRNTWAPLFGAANGTAELEAPAGSGHVLPKGTQLLIQLHLLNAATTDVKTKVSIKMREAATDTVKPIGLHAFGTNDITLPPSQTGSVTNDCTVDKDLDIFAWLPHMHKMGKSLSLLVGPDKDHLEEVYHLDPWNFDDQRVYSKELHIPKGSLTRVTCNYDNPSAKEVKFGESSNDEMCFLPTFVTGATEQLGGCVYLKPIDQTDVPPDPAAGVCGEQKPNSLGIGELCTKGGGECATGLSCTADQGSGDPSGFCIKIGGCKTTPDCGGDWATCCAPKEAGGLVNICIPEACRPSDCIPQK